MIDLIVKNAKIVDGSGDAAFTGDVAVADGKITDVGKVSGKARTTIDADGRLLTPGFVDIHTHFDGQVCWDKQVTPSCWHGVTTVVMGNCGVGFAPVHPGKEDDLVELMESVEDIPGSALHQGIPWTWESFPEYLDAIDTPYAIDIGTQVPHAAVRHYVMGERCYDDATDDDLEIMATLVREALEAGALGFSTSRFYGHVDKQGKLIPGTHASAKEMRTITSAFKGLDHGTIEIISDYLADADEQAWIEDILRSTKRPVTTLMGAGIKHPIWKFAERMNAEGFMMRPQVGARPASILMSLEGTINPMRIYPAYKEIASRPLEERVRLLRDPEFRQRVISEAPRHHRNADARRFTTDFAHMFPLDDALSYEPGEADSVAALAKSKGCTPREVIMDTMAEGRPLLFFFGNYEYNLDGQFASVSHPNSVFGLSDGGAHCGVLCDASVPTYMMSYVTQKRPRGTLPLEFVVHKMTQDTACVYGLNDRGLIRPGYKADLNLIDYEHLQLDPPRMVYDLPAGGKRIVQTAQGYDATICNGVVTYEHGEHTGEFPGRLIRGGAR
ncbi:MAG: amidohydrolase family protein [Gammaproteobacteria bacterium]|nr:amidohydrolase family protein [Gammaproteobacteria bacterium]